LRQLFDKGCFRIPKAELLAHQNMGILATLGANRVLGQSLHRLDNQKLLYYDNTNVSLSNIGILRVLQDISK
jgi:hypothetical protein